MYIRHVSRLSLQIQEITNDDDTLLWLTLLRTADFANGEHVRLADGSKSLATAKILLTKNPVNDA